LCPLELGPHLRLQFTAQAEGSNEDTPRQGAAGRSHHCLGGACRRRGRSMRLLLAPHRRRPVVARIPLLVRACVGA
jgi:hypothetical protein